MKLTNTNTFVSNVIRKMKPVAHEYTTYCSYCANIAIQDFEYQDHERFDYSFCTCQKSKYEREYKEKLKDLERQQRNVLYDLKALYKKKGVFI